MLIDWNPIKIHDNNAESALNSVDNRFQQFPYRHSRILLIFSSQPSSTATEASPEYSDVPVSIPKLSAATASLASTSSPTAVNRACSSSSSITAFNSRSFFL